MTFIITPGYLGNNLLVHRISANGPKEKKIERQEKLGPSVQILGILPHHPPTLPAPCRTAESNTRDDHHPRLNEPDFGPRNTQPKRSHHQQLLFIFFLSSRVLASHTSHSSRPALLLCARFSCPANWKMLLAAIYMKTVLTYHINPLWVESPGVLQGSNNNSPPRTVKMSKFSKWINFASRQIPKKGDWEKKKSNL